MDHLQQNQATPPPPQRSNSQLQDPQLIKSLAEFFRRDLISLPLIKKHPHQQIAQRCGLKTSTLEFDTAQYPNIEYIAGNRLNVYPLNPADQVNAIMRHLIDDLAPVALAASGSRDQSLAAKRPKVVPGTSSSGGGGCGQDILGKFVQTNGKESLRLALTHLYDIMTAPSRDLIRMLAECCSNKVDKNKLLAISRTDETWERWILQQMRTLKSTLDEYPSLNKISAKSLLSELAFQQPRQYSISSIKSSKRFTAQLIVIQHRFTPRLIAQSLQNLKEHETIQQLDINTGVPQQQQLNRSIGALQHVGHNVEPSGRSTRSIRSIRSMAVGSSIGLTSPISTQQVKQVPSYSGPLMSLYASSSMNAPPSSSSSSARLSQASLRLTASKSIIGASIGQRQQKPDSPGGGGSASMSKQYDGLCSNYLLNLNLNDHVVCEFVENPRFTLKGNRERPIIMIGQDVGVIAFRPFWQQRTLEYDRAQVFYTLFKDLSPKRFGDMQLVCLTGSKCKLEDLFKREISHVLTNKIISSASYIDRNHLLSLLDTAATSSIGGASGSTMAPQQQPQATTTTTLSKLPINSRELLDLGQRLAKLLIEANGCIYTCCDSQMTQAIEILIVESVAKLNSKLPRDRIMALLPLWKGRRLTADQPSPMANASTNKFLYTLENPFERAQIVQEIYDPSV